MTTRPARTAVKVATIACGAILTAGLLAAPAAATPLTAEGSGSAASCDVSRAELAWGVKESFRSYISGSIANGEWTTENGAGYETPNFLWATDTGSVDEELGSGEIAFIGSVHFTGHGGALAMDLADPVIEFDGDDAYLLLNIGATDNAEEEAPEGGEVRAAKLQLDGALDTQTDQFTITEATVRLTSAGANAFNGEYGSYAAGDEMDPVSVSAALPGCNLGSAAEPPAESEEPAAEEPIAQEPVVASAPFPWFPVIIGAVALLVIGVTSGMLFAGRRKKTDAQEQSGDQSTVPAESAASPAEGDTGLDWLNKE